MCVRENFWLRDESRKLSAVMNVSQQAAALLGERNRRSISRITGTGLSRVFGMSPSDGTDIAHFLMAVGIFVPESRKALGTGLAIAYLLGR